MFRIGEFSKLTQVSIRMLRHYDQCGLLKPESTDPATGYRLYSAAQIPHLNRIVFLRDMGFGVAEIADALNDWSDEAILARLSARRSEIERGIADEQARLQRIAQAEKDINSRSIAINSSVAVKAVPGCKVFSLRRILPDYYAEGPLWKELATLTGDIDTDSSIQPFTIYHDPEYKDRDVDVEICAPVLPETERVEGVTCRRTEAEPLMAYTMAYGPFENIDGVFQAFAGWLSKHDKYAMKGSSRQIVHRGPWNEEDAGDYLTEIQIPLMER